MTGVVHTAGAIYTSSNDKTIKVLEPSVNPQAIVTLQKHDSGVARVCCLKSVKKWESVYACKQSYKTFHSE